MSQRRPRVKPFANLDMKRKIKLEKPPDDVKYNIDELIDVKNIKSTTTENDKPNENIITNIDPIRTFKQPPAVSSIKLPSCSTTISSLDTDIIGGSGLGTFHQSTMPAATSVSSTQMQQQPHHHHHQQGVLLPRPRQRIRPMPCFGIRRNSVQGAANSDVEDDVRKHRSHNHPYYMDIPLNRRRTVSACSNASDTNIAVRDRIRKISSTITTATSDDISNSSITKIERKSPDKSALKMFDYIYYNPNKNPMVTEKKPDTIITEQNIDNNNASIKDKTITDIESLSTTKTNQGDDNNSEETSAAPVPQLILSASGELVLDEKSLIIETTAKKEARVTLAKSDVIYHDENTGSSGFYRRQKRTRDWTFDETVKFYRCLNTVGTDFSLMLSLFPNRSRRDIKLKFKKEEKCNASLVDKALLHPKAFNIEELKLQFEKDEREATEKLNKLEDDKNRAKAIKQSKDRKPGYSKAARMLSQGDLAYQNENTLTRLNKKKLCPISSTALSLQSNQLLSPPTAATNAGTSPQHAPSEDEQLTHSRMLIDAIIEKYEMENRQLEVTSKESNDHDNDNDNVSVSEFEEEELDIKNKYYNVDNVLQEIADGSLVLVASEDPIDPGKIKNEIYLYCKDTNQLSDEPLDLPRDIVDCIANEVSK